MIAGMRWIEVVSRLPRGSGLGMRESLVDSPWHIGLVEGGGGVAQKRGHCGIDGTAVCDRANSGIVVVRIVERGVARAKGVAGPMAMVHDWPDGKVWVGQRSPRCWKHTSMAESTHH